MKRESWLIEPRDPFVVRDGRLTSDLDTEPEWTIPMPQTVAGMVRTAFLAERGEITAAHAEDVRRVTIRGPWLVSREESQNGYDPLVPASLDLALDPQDGLRRATLTSEHRASLVCWGPVFDGATPLRRLVSFGTHEKLRSLTTVAPWQPLMQAVDLVTRRDLPRSIPSRGQGEEPASRERRFHVSLDAETETAIPGRLFATPGVRMREGFALAVDVEGPDDAAWAALPPLVQLGGESRLSRRTSLDRAIWPTWESVRARYEAATSGDARPAGLRLQLTTPGWFPAGVWRPGWMTSGRCPDLADVTVEMVAALVPGSIAVSGWDLQAAQGRGAPKAVRRLVPAGSVYYLTVSPWSAWEKVAEHFWSHPVDPDDNLGEGHGMALPGFWWEET